MSRLFFDDIERQYRQVTASAGGMRALTSGLMVPGHVDRSLPNVGLENIIIGGGNRRKTAGFGGADISQVSPEIRNPLLSLINFYLPYDRKTLNQWIRYYARFDPYVHNCIDLNSQFPISDFHWTGIDDPGLLQQFDELKEHARFFDWLCASSKEEETLGESHTFWQWDETDLTWSNYSIMNPDKLEIIALDWGSDNIFYFLDPPEKLKELQRRNDIDVQSVLDNLDPQVREALNSGKKIPLDPFNVLSIMRKESDYDERGTSPILSALKCFVPGTRVTMANGTTRAIEDVQVGDAVLCGTGQPTLVAQVHAVPETEKVVRLRDAIGNVVEATLDHRMYGFRPTFSGRTPQIENAVTSVQEIVAGELQIGDYLVAPIPQVDGTSNIDLDPWLLGYFVGDGSSMGEWQLAFVGSLDDRGKTCLSRVTRELERLGVKRSVTIERGTDGTKPSATRQPTSWRLSFCQQDIRQKFESALEGLVCKEKILKDCVLRLPLDQLAEFVQGWFDADGYTTKEGTERISTANEQLAQQLRFILARLGVYSSARRRSQSHATFGGGNDIWHVSFRRTSTRRRKFEAFVQDGYIFSKIIEREERSFNGSVHCITVENDSHTFIAGGVKVRNCLMYKDKLIEAQYSIADGMITPVQLWKIGDPAHNYMPNEGQLQAFRAMLQAGRHDPLFTIVTHAAVNLELIGYAGKLLPIIPELEWVAKQVMIAMFVNEATISGNGPGFGTAIVPFKILQGRYQASRNRKAEAIKQKLLKPFAEARGMFKTTQAEIQHRIRTKKVPIVPDLSWNFKLDLTDSAQKMQYLMNLRDKGVMPMRTLCEMFNLDEEAVKKALKDEEGTVFDGAYQEARKKKAVEGTAAAPGAAGGAAPGAAGGASAGAPGDDVQGAGVEATPPGGAGGGEPPAGGQ